jgi:glycosyltransferase involved in cell wall biosynthesis
MRVVVVSAHYPPNFVSGGTLQPQRLARGMRARGHDVSVYAGWLGDRPPLDSWQELDETGMPVHWIVTTPWTGWDDRRNYDNPRVARNFADHLDEVRPDLVHLHALQSLGAGLVGVAKDSGARVVLTMHDFWWTCARQFLVTKEFRQCCLVVNAGDCPCQLDHSWLAARADRLRSAMRRADVILAPSQIAASVLVANGVPPDRLVVNENGLVEAPVMPVAGSSHRRDTLRAVYTGGPSEMKGAHVLVDAVELLRGRTDLTVAAYGLQPYLQASGRSVSGLPIQVRPAFAPEQLDEVLAEADVLLLPSVMRESHSIVTREALLRRVPVIATDSLGPEEVVKHGRNGLLVPSGDAPALARAVSRASSDPALLDRLRRGSEGVQVTSLEAQLTNLEKVYTDQSSPRQSDSPTIRTVLFVVGIEGAPLRYRAHLPAEALALQGVRSTVRHYRDPELALLMAAADVIVVYRVPATIQILAALGEARRRGTPLLFDVDDLIFDPLIADDIPALKQLPRDEAALWLEGVQRYRTTMEACDVFIGSTARLCEHAEQVVGLPAERFANGVGVQLGRHSDHAVGRSRTPGPLRIGYFSGTTTHDADWRSIEPAVVEVMLSHPDVELWLGGHLHTGSDLAVVADRVRRMPFMHWTGLPRVLRDVDVNLAPLTPAGAFNDAKSAIKWLEAALVETVTVATPTEPFVEAVRTGENGALANGHTEWVQQISWLLGDVDARERLGRRARRDALLTLSPHLQGQRYLEILCRAAEHARKGRRPSAWIPVLKDEPTMPSPLEPYGDLSRPSETAPGSTLRRRAQHASMLIAVARTMARESGYKIMARRAAAYARRRALSRLG